MLHGGLAGRGRGFVEHAIRRVDGGCFGVAEVFKTILVRGTLQPQDEAFPLERAALKVAAFGPKRPARAPRSRRCADHEPEHVRAAVDPLRNMVTTWRTLEVRDDHGACRRTGKECVRAVGTTTKR